MSQFERAPSESTSDGSLVRRAQAGDRRALSDLFRRHRPALRRFAMARLPRFMRAAVDVSDVVQEVLLKTFLGLGRFEDRGHGALRAFLLKAISNRIQDEQRKVDRRPQSVGLDDLALAIHDDDPSPYEFALTAEEEEYYKRGLLLLSDDERTLIVGRLELGYNYDQLALVAGKATAEAARIAVRRAIVKLAAAIDNLLSDASRG